MAKKSKVPITTYLVMLLLIGLSFFAGYYFFKSKNLEQNAAAGTAPDTAQPQQRPTSLKIKKPVTSEHWRGSKDVRYVWVEYTDLECPFCKQIHPDLQKLMKEYDGKIAWVFRQFPLPFHPKAQKSAEAIECAADLSDNNGFWTMVDTIFEKMPNMELSELATIASGQGINQTAFSECLDSGKFENKVKDQETEGQNAGVQATPTNVVYDLKTGKNVLIEGALPYDSLKQSLDKFLSENK